MNEQSCAARKALEACVSLFENWRDGHFSSLGIRWEVEPPAIVSARKALAAPCEHAAEAERLRSTIGGIEQAIGFFGTHQDLVPVVQGIIEKRDQLRAELETLKAERQECVRALAPLANWFRNGTDATPTHGHVRRASELHARLTQEQNAEQDNES